MKQTKKNHGVKCLDILRQLAKSYPEIAVMEHITRATADYSETCLADKEFSFALTKYKVSLDLEMEIHPSSKQDSELDKIIREGMNLDTILDEEGEEDDY